MISIAGKVKPLSYDHKPTDETEMERIISAGGYVEFGRVNGNLALSRAIGDFEFKQSEDLPAEKQVVTCKFLFICYETRFILYILTLDIQKVTLILLHIKYPTMMNSLY